MKEYIMSHELAYVGLKVLALWGLISLVGIIFLVTCLAIYRNNLNL